MMETKIVLLISNLLVYYLANVNATMLNYFGMVQGVLNNFEIQDPDHLIQSTSKVSVFICMSECTKNSQCLSFSYNKDSQSCMLYDVVYGSEERGVGTTATKHYDVGERGKYFGLNIFMIKYITI